MTVSLNGWPVPPKDLKTFKVPGADRKLTLDADAGRLLVALTADYHKLVRKIDRGAWDEGGYNNREARYADGMSNHASGTAVDINWSQEGAAGSAAGKKFFAAAKAKAAVAVLKLRYGSCIGWGGDWNKKDYMHWEIKPGVTRAEVLTACKRLKINEEGVRRA